jgi:hypothetical protein
MSSTHPVTFPEGLTIAKWGEIFGRSGLGAAKDFVRAASDVLPGRRA